MGRRGLTGRLRLSWLVRAMVVLASVINTLLAAVRSWPDAVFVGRRGLTGRLRLSWLVRAMVVLAGVINVLVATVHSWPDAVFFGGFLALLPTEVRMIYLVRVRKTRAARWPLFIAAAGVFASVIMMSRKPQPLIATGCVDIAVAAAAWGVYFLITHALAGSAAKPDSGDRGDTPA